MAISITGMSEALKTYLDASKSTLISDVIFSEDLIRYFNLMTGCKSAKEAIVLLDQTIELGDGTTCGFSDAGKTDFSDRQIEMGFAKVNKSFCDKTLLKSALANEVAVAAGREKMPYSEKITSDLVALINKEKARQMFIGKTESGDKINGIVTTIEADVKSGVVKNVVDKASDTIDVRIEKLWKSIAPEHQNAEIFMSIPLFKDLILAYEKQDHYHFDLKQNLNDMEMVLPYSNTVVHGIAAMGNSETIFATPLWNLFMGVDGENDNEEFDLFYSKDNQEFRFVCNFAFGVNYAIADAIYVNGTPQA